MIYKTLHWYILRELLRVFLMTASALTTLLAFGGMFKPLTKEGLDVFQLMMITTNLMPAMLAYAIPIAALFAAVLVYWRLSTDNELTACRASGVSFWSILMPALMLGIVVAVVDLVFVNFVVPSFLQSTERLIRRDAAQLMIGAITKQDVYRDPNDKMVIYADSAEEIETGNPDVTKVHLIGVVGVKLKQDKTPQMIGTALEADVTFTQRRDPATGKLTDDTEVTITVKEAAAYDPQRFTSLKKDFEEIMPPSRPYILTSQLKNKPKFSNYYELGTLNAEPWRYGPLREQVGKFERLLKQQIVSTKLHEEYLATNPNQLRFVEKDTDRKGKEINTTYIVTAKTEQLGKDSIILTGEPKNMVKVEVYEGLVDAVPDPRKLFRRYETVSADITLDSDELSSTMRATLNLRGTVTKEEKIDDKNWTAKIQLTGVGEMLAGGPPKEFVESISGLRNPALPEDTSTTNMTTEEYKKSLEAALYQMKLGVKGRLTETARLVVETQNELTHTISSEKHSRGSFSVSCLTLVMFGAALGVMLKGRNPLAVFVMGFMPSVLLVLLITMGRRVMETANGNQTLGLCLLWAGNGVLVILVMGAYRKLMKT